MGQRLELAITANGTKLANAYYHWSGYTSSALELAQIVVNAADDNPDTTVQNAVALLEKTGAGLSEKEMDIYARRYIFTEGHKVSHDRNDGLIAISADGMSETSYWAEAFITVDLVEATVELGVFVKEDIDEAIKYDKELVEMASWYTPPDVVSFEDFELVKDVIMEYIKNRRPCTRDRNHVYFFIE